MHPGIAQCIRNGGVRLRKLRWPSGEGLPTSSAVQRMSAVTMLVGAKPGQRFYGVARYAGNVESPPPSLTISFRIGAIRICFGTPIIGRRFVHPAMGERPQGENDEGEEKEA